MTQRETSADYRKYDSESVEIAESDDIRGGQFKKVCLRKIDLRAGVSCDESQNDIAGDSRNC